jgi:hypothetical protein
VKISEVDHARIIDFAEQRRESQGEVITAALNALESEQFWRDVQQAEPPSEEEMAEFQLWDAAASEDFERFIAGAEA